MPVVDPVEVGVGEGVVAAVLSDWIQAAQTESIPVVAAKAWFEPSTINPMEANPRIVLFILTSPWPTKVQSAE
jgi:hypothetical protein